MYWFKVQDILPEENKVVLVYICENFYLTAFREDGEWVDFSTGDVIADVKEWCEIER